MAEMMTVMSCAAKRCIFHSCTILPVTKMAAQKAVFKLFIRL